MKNFGKLLSFEQKDNKVHLTYENGNARIEIIRDDIINVFSAFESEEHYSKAIEGDKCIPTQFTAEKTADGLKITTAKAELLIFDNFKMDFYDKKGNCLCRDSRIERQVVSGMTEDEKRLLKLEGHSIPDDYTEFNIFVQKEIEGDERFYGLGDKTGFINKRGYQYKMWNTDDPRTHTELYEVLYKSIPFMITLKNAGMYGLFFDNTNKSVFNLGLENPEFFWYGVNNGNLDYYYIAGDSLKEIVSAYTYLTGRTPMPQLWALGHQQSRFGYIDERDIMSVAQNMRECRVPCDVIHFDIDYMNDFKVFTFHPKRYPDPAKTIANLKADGFKTVTIIDPGVKVQGGYDIYDDGLEKGYFAKDKNGIPFVGEVWPGDSVYPEFGRQDVRDWWGDNHKRLFDIGVAGIWNDMNEPACFTGDLPDDVVMYDEERRSSHREMHNVYGHNMSKATHYGLKKHTGKRPFVITRACYAGSQKYTTAWTGDNASLWLHLQMAIPQLCNLGLSGMAFVGTDLGGFGGTCRPELMARWVQLAAFSPLCRNHCSKGRPNQEPWCFGEEVLDIYRKFISLRYELLPLMYDNFRICEQTGYPIMRPMVFEFPEDKKCHEMDSQFMFGENMLIAPVVNKGDRHKCVYLPDGVWYDFFTGEKIAGAKRFVREAQLDECPIYVKAGTMIPKWEAQQYVGEKENDTLYLEIFGDTAEYEHYQDNGSDFKYSQGEYNTYFFKYENGEFTADLSHNGYENKYKKIVVKKDGKTVEAAFADGMKITL